MTLSRLALSTLALIGLAVTTPSRANEALDGYWIDSDGEVILDIRPCGDAHCGRVAWLRLPNGPDGQELLDYRNPDPALRERPVCGLDVVTGFKRQPDGTWGDGTVYVSDLGTSFSGYAEIVNPDQVKVTGYIGISLFGKSETWSRVKHEFELCWTKPGAKAAAIMKEGKTASPPPTGQAQQVPVPPQKTDQAKKAPAAPPAPPLASSPGASAAPPAISPAPAAPVELKSTKTD